MAHGVALLKCSRNNKNNKVERMNHNQTDGRRHRWYAAGSSLDQ